MLSGLRAGTPLYILDKNKRKVSIGEVLAVSNPMPQYGMTYTPNGLTPPSLTVDIRARVDGTEVNFTKLPAGATIADFSQSGIVVSESREAIFNEVEAFQKRSENALTEVPMHEEIVAKCKEMKLFLNPQAKRDEEQSREITTLREEVSAMSGQIKDMGSMLARLLEGKPKKKEE